MHILIVYVTYLNENTTPYTPLIGNGSDYYASNAIPTWATGNGLIASDVSQIDEADFNLSSYYRTMSFGEFELTGEIVSISHDNIADTETNSLASSGKSKIGQSDWSNFNLRDCDGSWQIDDSSSMPDATNKFDYIAVIRKWDGNTGLTSFNNSESESGHWQKNTNSKIMTMITFIHEFAHQMYSAAHVCGANGVIHPHFNMQEGWGMVANPSSHFLMARANEMWVNGWLRNGQDVIEVNTNNVNEYACGILLGDLLGTRKAIRIEIPNSNPNPNEANHFLWIENHQKMHSSGFDADPAGDIITQAGIYMYISSKLNDLNHTFEGLQSGNNIHTLHPYGKKDFALNSTRNGFIEGKDNPIAGLPVESYVRMNDPNHPDYTSKPNKIFHCDNQNDDKMSCGGVKSEHSGSITEDDFRVTNNYRKAFQAGDSLSINGIHPVLNYPEYDHINDTQEPFNLNGLKVVIAQDTSDNGGNFKINISYDDWTFESDKRWCGIINLPTDNNLTLSDQSNINLNLSGTANRSGFVKNRGDSMIKNFVDPTILTAQPTPA